jgi:hypothetical protein
LGESFQRRQSHLANQQFGSQIFIETFEALNPLNLLKPSHFIFNIGKYGEAGFTVTVLARGFTTKSMASIGI